MRAIVHIGMPKTGTTAIQSWLAANADGLRAQGTLYDRIALPGVRQYVAHVELYLAQLSALGRVTQNRQSRATYGIASAADQDRVVDAFAAGVRVAVAKAADATQMIFSSEQIGAMTRTPKEVRALHDWLGQFFDDVQYVVYLRRLEDWLASNYAQTLRRGATHGFEDYINARMAMNYMQVLRPFAKVAGGGAVTVRLCEADALVGNDVIMDFATTCGIDPTGLARPDRSNEALSAGACAVLRHLNTRLGPRAGAPDGRLLVRAKNAINALADGGERHALTPALTDAVRTANAQSNARVCETFFPDRTELFPAKPVAAGCLTAPPQDVARVAEAVARKLGRAIRPHLADVTQREAAQ